MSPAPHLYHLWHLVTSLFFPLSCCLRSGAVSSPPPPQPDFQPGFPGCTISPLLPYPTYPIHPQSISKASGGGVTLPFPSHIPPSHRGMGEGGRLLLLIQAPIQECSSPAHIPHPLPHQPRLSLPREGIAREVPSVFLALPFMSDKCFDLFEQS